MNFSPLLALVLALLGLLATSVAAQPIAPPPRSVDQARQAQDRNRQELSLSMDLLGGYDHNTEVGGLAAANRAPGQDGYNGDLGASILYWLGRTSRFMEISGRSNMNTYSDLSVDPLVGGNASIRLGTTHGRTTVSASVLAQYLPTYAVTSMPLLPGQAETVAVAQNPSQAVADVRSFGTNSSVSLLRNWSARHRMNLNYSFSDQRFIEGEGLDARSHGVSGTYHWEFTANSGTRLLYRRAQLFQTLTDGTRQPMLSQSAELGFEYRVPISRLRRLALSLGGGASQVDQDVSIAGAPGRHASPSGFGSATLDLGRSWALAASGRRDVTVLSGLSTQPFFTDNFSLAAGGRVFGSAELTFTGGLSRGEASDGATSSYDSANATIQLAYATSRCCSMLTSVSYFQNHLRDVADLPSGFPAYSERYSARIGFRVLMPILGGTSTRRR